MRSRTIHASSSLGLGIVDILPSQGLDVGPGQPAFLFCRPPCIRGGDQGAHVDLLPPLGLGAGRRALGCSLLGGAWSRALDLLGGDGSRGVGGRGDVVGRSGSLDVLVPVLRCHGEAHEALVGHSKVTPGPRCNRERLAEVSPACDAWCEEQSQVLTLHRIRFMARMQRLQNPREAVERERESRILHVGPHIRRAGALVARSSLLLTQLEFGGDLEVCVQQVGLAFLSIVVEVGFDVQGWGDLHGQRMLGDWWVELGFCGDRGVDMSLCVGVANAVEDVGC